MPIHLLTTSIHQAVVDFVAAGRPFALVTVLRDSGSTPRKAGTQAIVDAEGSIWGTIGGGLLESEARRQAVESIITGCAGVFDFRFAGTSAAEDVPVCGGTMRAPIDPTAADRASVHEEGAAALRQRRRGVLVTVVQRGQSPMVQLKWCATEIDSPPAPNGFSPMVAEAVRNAHLNNQCWSFHDVQNAMEGLAEPVLPTPLLIVAGGGHVGQALVRQAVIVGFDVVAVDDRAEFSDPSHYPPGVMVRCNPMAEVLAEFPVTPDTYVALVGRGHLSDAKGLEACLHSPAAYIGMMGSRRKIAILRHDFIASGRATEAQFARIHAPIGLDIGAQTVPEIAASIVAELVAVRRMGRSPRLR